MFLPSGPVRLDWPRQEIELAVGDTDTLLQLTARTAAVSFLPQPSQICRSGAKLQDTEYLHCRNQESRSIA